MSHVDILREEQMGVEKFYEKLTGIGDNADSIQSTFINANENTQDTNT